MQIKKCCEEIKNELALIDELFLSHALLLKKVKRVEPDQIEISAVATYSFPYSLQPLKSLYSPYK